MAQETRNPSGEAGVSAFVNVLPGNIDGTQDTQNPIVLQVHRLRRRFVLSEALARAVAFHAYPAGGVA